VELLSDFTTGIQNTAFCQKNEIQSERLCNKYQYSVSLRLQSHPPPPGYRVCGDLTNATDLKER